MLTIKRIYCNKVSLNILFNNISSCDEGAQEIVIKAPSTISCFINI